MEDKELKTKHILNKDDNLLNDELLTFDLPTFIEKMKHSSAWKKGAVSTMILLKRPDKQIVLTALHEETEIKSFQSNISITIQVIEGELKFQTTNQNVTLEKGQLMTIREKIKYSLTTESEAIILLTSVVEMKEPEEDQIPWFL